MLALMLLLACLDTTPPPPPPMTVEVVRGDTLGKIAKTHDVSVSDLKTWNGLSSDRIDVGQVLQVESGAGGGRASEPTTKPRPRRGTGTPAPRTATVPSLDDPSGPTVPKLKLPPKKACLAGPSGTGEGDFEMATNQGLTQAGTSAAMNAFLPAVSSCLVGMDDWPTTSLDLEIHVACTGRVDSVTIQGSNDWPAANAACLTKALRFAAFPAHARPVGDSFLYPLRMQ